MNGDIIFELVLLPKRLLEGVLPCKIRVGGYTELAYIS